ncbi:MAG: hypothetical protein KDB80_08975, partial [Planctomycetes bacterium]|nr:hypothetical protein [Planctomycetota bacterium]
MDFSDLTRLWWLLALPLAIWLARPPRPRARVATAHLPQWRAAAAAIGRRPVRWRIVRLLLLLVGGAALVFAAAGPQIRGDAGPLRLVVLVDRSASMGRGGAWDEARAELTRVLERVPSHV